jgi:hypothetical protein
VSTRVCPICARRCLRRTCATYGGTTCSPAPPSSTRIDVTLTTGASCVVVPRVLKGNCSENRNNIGENIWVAPYANYSDAVQLWFDEWKDKQCGCQHVYKHCCGHYTQVAWADTYLMGCGFAQCSDMWGAAVQGRGHRNILVCHYTPAGACARAHAHAHRTAQATSSKCSPAAPTTCPHSISPTARTASAANVRRRRRGVGRTHCATNARCTP